MKKTQLDNIIRSINDLSKGMDILFVAIDGRSSSGKTTLANQINQLIDCNVIHVDDYFMSKDQIDEKSKEHAKNIDFNRMINEVINPIRNKQNFSIQPFLCDIQKLGNKEVASFKKINIIEGAYSMHPILYNIYRYKIFLNVSPFQQKMRVLKRNGIKKLKVYIKKWIPLENRYFNELNIIDKADVVIY
jgi:uridine kinase